MHFHLKFFNIYIYIYIVQFTVGDVPMGEVLVDEQQMEREPHEVLHDFFLHFVFYMKFYIFSLNFKTSNFNVCTHCVQVPHASQGHSRIVTFLVETLHPSVFTG